MLRILNPLVAVIALCAAAPAAQSGVREIAVTLDDLPTVSAYPHGPDGASRLTSDLLAALRSHAVPGVGFVNEGKLRIDGRVDESQVGLLRLWVDGGFELGNHTYSHLDRHAVAASEYEADIVRGDEVTRRLLQAAGRQPRFFRHPFLHTGRSLRERAALDAFLRDRGYRVAPVTIDNYDYLFARAYDRAVHDGDPAQRDRIAAAYLDYLVSVVGYYEQQSAALLGRALRQVLLLHANALNAATFDALAGRLERRGYRFVTLDRALEDPAYSQEDTYTGSGGISWIHRWALTQKKPRTFFAGEPEVPRWISEAR